MGSSPVKGCGQGTSKPQKSKDDKNPPPRQPSKPAAASPQAAGRRTLSKSVASFICRLRPSQRPERGGTARPTTDNTAGYQPVTPRPPNQTAGGQRARSRSLDRPSSYTIPPGLWNNTPATLPRRAHSTGSKPAKERTATPRPPLTKHHNAPHCLPPPNANRSAPPSHPGPRARTQRATNDTAPTNPTSPSLHRRALTPYGPTPNPPPPAPALPPTSSSLSHDLFLARRALRRQRRSLKASGDFLGVTGVNPYTGEPDVITPPTSSSSDGRQRGGAVPTSSSTSSSLSSSSPSFSLAAAAVTTTTDSAQQRETDEQQQLARRREKEARRVRREEERLGRAARRKEALREVLLRQRVRWRRDEDGWSSVAEPRLSPIPGSRQGSGGNAGGDHLDLVVNTRPEQSPFLGMAAVTGGMEPYRSRRRCCSMGDRGLLRGHRAPPGRLPVLGVHQRHGIFSGASCDLSRVMRMRLSLALASRLQAPDLEWESGSLTGPPAPYVGFRSFSEDSMMFSSPVLDHDVLSPAARGTDKLIRNLYSQARSSEASDKGTVLCTRSPTASDNGGPQAFPSACTPTITTTGCERSQPPFPADRRLSDATADESVATAPTRRPGTPTSLLSWITAPNCACSEPSAFPPRTQPSSWPRPASTAPNMAPIPDTRVIMPVKKPPTPPPSPEPEPESATTSSSTGGARAAPTQEAPPNPSRRTAASAKGPLRPTQQRDQQREKANERDKEMPKTLRPVGNHNAKKENRNVGTRRLSPTSTSTWCRPATSEQPQQAQAATDAAAAADELGRLIARGAARTAFQHLVPAQPAPTARTAMPRAPSSAARKDPSTPGPKSDSQGAKPTVAAAAGTDKAKPGEQRQGKRQSGVAGTGKKVKKVKEKAGEEKRGKGKTGGEKGEEGKRGKGKGQEEKGKKESGKKEAAREEKEKAAVDGGKDGDVGSLPSRQVKEEKEKAAMDDGKNGDVGSLSARQVASFAQQAVAVLARAVAAYWRVVCPMFDDGSERRKRLDQAQATWGDWVVCLLAVVFLFLAASASVWLARGMVWVVRLLREVAVVLRVVAGL